MYRKAEPSESVSFGEGQIAAKQTWTDGYGRISMVEDDHCFVFILESTGKHLSWIPTEVIETIEHHKDLNVESATGVQG